MKTWLVLLLAVALTACSGGTPARETSRNTSPTAAAVRRPRSKGGDVIDCPRKALPAGDDDRVHLTDVTEASGLVDPLLGMYSHAAATADVNGDGWLDLFVGTFTDKPDAKYLERGATRPSPDRLLLGGPGGFHTDASFADGKGRSTGAAFADLDGDGDLDLVVSRNVTKRSPAGEDTVILRNDGGKFTIADHPVSGLGARGVGVLDFDRDGRLDLFVTEDHYTGGSSRLLHNDGQLRFSDRTDKSGLPADVAGFSAAAADLTGDGWPDLFVAGSNRLFVNNRKGGFDEADSSVFRWPTYGKEDDVTGVAVGDLNGDGRADLVLGGHYNSTVDFGCTVPPRLYLQQPSGRAQFRDVTDESGLTALPTKAPHIEIADMDNDGLPDIVASASAANGQFPTVLRNLGVRDGVPHFSAPAGLGDPRYWVTGVTGDFDHDGRLDVFVVGIEPAQPSLLLRNATNGGHWIDVAVPADAAGAGAVVSVARDGSLIASQVVVLTQGYGAGRAGVVHLGVGDAKVVDVSVQPLVGKKRTRAQAPVDRTLRYPEDFAA